MGSRIAPARRRLGAAAAAALLAGGLAGCGGNGGSRSGVTAAPTTNGGSRAVGLGLEGDCSRTSVGFTALTDLGQRTYRGFEGGLYPGGRNTPPRSYLDAGLSAAGRVRPLAPNGRPSPSGRIGLVSIGMSNTSREFIGFVRVAARDRALIPGALQRQPRAALGQQSLGPVRESEASLSLDASHVVLVNGAVPNFDAELMLQSEATYLKDVDTKLADAGVTPDQVQAAWIDEAIANEHEPFPLDARHLQRDLNAIIAMVAAHFPNLRLVYVSSREYAGYAIPRQRINPEPYAYESGFAVKWAVAGKMADPRTRPWVAWGPYTWADGTHPRSDGLTWSCADFQRDGTHPSAQGTEKVGRMLLRFFTTDSTARTWFDTPSR